ncbi:MAG: type II secretion system protein J [Puniceicoccaceae bacterium]
MSLKSSPNPFGNKIVRQTQTGFTLIEILLAVGVFALTIIGMIALLTPVTKQVRDIFEDNLASRTIGAIEEEVRRMERTPGASPRRSGFFFFVNDSLNGLVNTRATLYATEDGARAREIRVVGNPATGSPRGIPENERFFEIFVETFPPGEDLAYVNQNAYIPLKITMTWPFRLNDGSPTGIPVDPEDRRSFTYTTAIVAGQ